jgi:PAS domain S-box-containing protein
MDGDNRQSILVIDDDEAVLLSQAGYLEDLGYTVRCASNGEQGLALFRSDPPDMILCDLRMPGIDGLEVLRAVRRESPDMPFVIISGMGVMKDVIEALRLGAWDYLPKPFDDFSILRHTVEKMLDRVRLMQQNRRYQEQLEGEVQRRTADLEKANRELRHEILARQERESTLRLINRRLSLMIESTRSLTRHANIDLLGLQVLKEFAGSMDAEGGSLFLRREDQLVCICSLDQRHVPDTIPLPPHPRSVFSRVLESGTAVMIGNIESRSNTSPSGWDGYRSGALLAIPMTDSKGQVFGIVSLHNKTSGPFTRHDLDLGTLMASFCYETFRATLAFESMQESKTRLSTILSCLQAGILLVDTKSGLVTEANPKALEMIGATAEEVIGHPAKAFISDPRDSQGNLLRRSKNGYETFESTLVRMDGHHLPVLRTIAIIELKGQHHLVENIIDLSQHKKMDDERRQLKRHLIRAQKMESIATLAGGIAHDFNNILAAIMGNAELMEMDEVARGDKELAKRLDSILVASRRARELIARILSFSRPSRQAAESIRLDTIIRETAKLLNASLPSTISIRLEIAPGCDAIVADPTQIHQVLMNLCTNAYHALQEQGGEICIALDQVSTGKTSPGHLVDLAPGEHLCLSVSDTGGGMEPWVLEQVFDPYFTTKEKDVGTGLGLSVVHGIVKSQGGTITVHSEKGKGSRFDIYFPCDDHIENFRPLEARAMQQGKERILLVDDEPPLVDVMAQMLTKLGYHVRLETNPLQALAAFEKNPQDYDLVLTDLTMPKLSGTAMAKQMVAIRPGLPIILFTGNGELVTEKLLKQSGIRRLLIKPVALPELSQIVRDTLDG